ncbi:unnamed protein product [Closterium sp. NIES-64]|nr:unnamed protein product [Closterium sp. NIES-64]CAI5983605.1 unnamed protein product [Closterium sp. NIES-65]
MPSTAAVHAPVSHHLGSTLSKQHVPLRSVGIAAGSARNMQTVFEDEDNWLLSYLASTSVGKDPRLNAATVKAASPPAAATAAATAAPASASSAPVSAGADVSSSPLAPPVDAAAESSRRTSPPRAATAVTTSNGGAAHKLPDTSADNSSISGEASATSGATAAAVDPPVTSLAAQQQQSIPPTVKLPKSQSAAPRFRSLAPAADEGTSFVDPDVAAAAAASAAAVSAIAAAVSGTSMKSPPESFNDWVAGAGRKYRRHSTAASPSAAPGAGFGAGAGAGAGGASALHGDMLGQGVAMAADAAAATGAAGRRRRSSVGRVSMSGRRQSMDYSELDAIRERLLHAAHLWAVAAPDETEEDEEEDHDAEENVKVDPPMARSGLSAATVDKLSASSKAGEALKNETDKARGEKLGGEAAAGGAEGGGGSPESAASGALMTRRRAGSVEGIGGSFEDGMGGNGSGSGGGGSGKLLSSQAAMMEANRDPTKSPSSFIKKWMKGPSGLGK